ncbi:hypothetical protein F511_34217 [Dorcoceras hygrometricum]|uniref:Uncharacterized protein n=1 Tax=Dorcoceras hygrometricum TaxID=472368 RepID=A0A2Z7BGM0_9LAMI|nr:hypothetical protein F511_34217 [Dorcoceras hygrometricum]
MILIDGSWTVAEGTDPWWRCWCRSDISRKRKQLQQRPNVDAFAPICLFIEPVQACAVQNYVLTDPNQRSDTTVGSGGSGSRSRGAAEDLKIFHRKRSIHNNKGNKTSIGCFRSIPCWRLGAWLRPISRGNWHFNGWRLSFFESGPRLESRLLHQFALEKVTKLSRMESPRRGGRNKSDCKTVGDKWHDDGRRMGRAAERERRRVGGCRTSILPPPMLNKLSLISVLESRNQYLCDPQWFRDTARCGPTTCITDSVCKNQSVMVSVQYGPFNTYIPIRSTTIGKSRVARDPITMHTSRRSNSDIACVTR